MAARHGAYIGHAPLLELDILRLDHALLLFDLAPQRGVSLFRLIVELLELSVLELELTVPDRQLVVVVCVGSLEMVRQRRVLFAALFAVLPP